MRQNMQNDDFILGQDFDELIDDCEAEQELARAEFEESYLLDFERWDALTCEQQIQILQENPELAVYFDIH